MHACTCQRMHASGMGASARQITTASAGVRSLARRLQRLAVRSTCHESCMRRAGPVRWVRFVSFGCMSFICLSSYPLAYRPARLLQSISLLCSGARRAGSPCPRIVRAAPSIWLDTCNVQQGFAPPPPPAHRTRLVTAKVPCKAETTVTHSLLHSTRQSISLSVSGFSAILRCELAVSSP